jgi:allantoinase
MSDFELVICGTVVLSTAVIERGYVAVRNGKIAAVGEGPAPRARKRHDFGEALVLPGAIDAQVHSLSQKGQEGFAWSTRSAAAGGVTTIVDMPYDEDRLVCSGEAVRLKAEEGAREARVDFALYGTINPADGCARIAEQVVAGVAAFKFSTFGTDPLRFPRISPPLLAEAFAAIAPTGLSAGVHNEDDESVRAGIAAVQAAGVTDWRAHALSRPPLSELLATLQIYETGAQTGCPAHVVHCSLGRGYDIAADYRARGFEATIECCIHYLTLDETDVARLGGKAKINPPIRDRLEVEKLWRHVVAGNVTLVSTDHVSWSEDRKSDPQMLANASGVPGLEVLVPLFVKGAVERDISLTWAARLMAENPARHFRIDHRKGALEVGKDADITVLVPRPKVYEAAASGNNVVGWSPYDGTTLPWTVDATWLRGELAFDGAEVLAQPGQGQFVSPEGRA